MSQRRKVVSKSGSSKTTKQHRIGKRVNGVTKVHGTRSSMEVTQQSQSKGKQNKYYSVNNMKNNLDVINEESESSVLLLYQV